MVSIDVLAGNLSLRINCNSETAAMVLIFSRTSRKTHKKFGMVISPYSTNPIVKKFLFHLYLTSPCLNFKR